MTCYSNRREWMSLGILGATALIGGIDPTRCSVSARELEPDGERLARETLDFISRCRRDDGGYAASPDPAYAGESDTGSATWRP